MSEAVIVWRGVLLFRGTGVVCEVDSWRSLCESLLGFALIFFAFLLLLAEAIFQDNRSDHLRNCHGEDFHSYIKLPAFSVTSLPNISPGCQSQLRVVLMSRDWNWWLVWRWKKFDAFTCICKVAQCFVLHCGKTANSGEMFTELPQIQKERKQNWNNTIV